jgi:hypothetical protein
VPLFNVALIFSFMSWFTGDRAGIWLELLLIDMGDFVLRVGVAVIVC